MATIAMVNQIFLSRGSDAAAQYAEVSCLHSIADKIRKGKWDPNWKPEKKTASRSSPCRSGKTAREGGPKTSAARKANKRAESRQLRAKMRSGSSKRTK